jgi:tetratricopeptide (TPR) repeat protein
MRRATAGVAIALIAAVAAGSAAGNPLQSGTRPPAAAGPAAALKAASTALDEGNPQRALTLLAPFIRQYPDDVRSRLLAARAHLAREEYGAAHEHLRRARASNPRNVDVLYYLGVVASELAAREFERLYQLTPDGARAHQLTAEALVLQQKLTEAATEYEAALAVAPAHLDVLIGLAEVRREQGDCAAAIALYERAEIVKPTYEAAYGLGSCLAVQNDHPKAAKQFQNAIIRDPQSAAAQFALGSSLLQLGDPAAATTALERAVALQPRLRQAYYLLGRTYRLLGKDDLSKQAYARADGLLKDERAVDEKSLGVTRPPTRVIRPHDRQ